MKLGAVAGEKMAAGAMLVAALAALAAVTRVAHRSTNDIVDTSAKVLHTQQVLTELERVVGEMLWAQGLHRAFAVTLEPRYSREFSRLLPDVYVELRRLRSMVATNPTQLQRLSQVETVIERKVATINASFALIRAHGYRRGEQARLIDRGAAAMESLRNIVAEMEEGERGVLVMRVEAEREAAGRALHFQIAAVAAAGFFLIAAVAILTLQIRQRRAVEASLAARGRELQRSNEELEQFAYASSHDLQEPLRKVANYSELLERRYKGKLGGDADKYIAVIVDGAKRMSELISDLLALSRVRARPPELEPVESAAALAAALANLEESIGEAGASVVSGELPRVRADRAQLVAVFQNLVGNAVKFHAEGRAPAVRVEASRQGDHWLFSVADNGIGIPAEYFGRIFIVFHRLHPRDEYSGTGIGLALCKRIIEDHGGRIWVESEVGRGSTFKFTLPEAA